MLQITNKTQFIIIGISLWTLVQTIFHIFWIAYGYLLTICKAKPTYYDVVFVYLTYFYRNKCGSINVRNEALLLNSTITKFERHSPNETVSDILYNFLNEILDGGKWPEITNNAARTDLYLSLFFICDIAWTVSAIFLFVSAFWKRECKYLSIVFYGPWLVVSAFVSFLDVVSAVHYGLDMIYIHSYTEWLIFIGVANYQDFQDYNVYPSSKLIPTIPTSIMTLLLSRFVVGWLVNVVCFFIILFLTIPQYKNPTKKGNREPRISKLQLDSGEELDLNSSEARIRNWQLFYGAIDATSTMNSSASPRSSTGITSTSDPLNIFGHSRSLSLGKEPIQNEKKSIRASNNLRRYSDVTQCDSISSADSLKMQYLKGSIPWSYISTEGSYIPKSKLIKNGHRPKTVQINDNFSATSRF